MFYVKENKGEYYLASEKWGIMYESGALADKNPVAGFIDVQDAVLFIELKNQRGKLPTTPRQYIECDAGCQYYSGSLNEEKCDYCIRKGNLRDFYEPKVKQFP